MRKTSRIKKIYLLLASYFIILFTVKHNSNPPTITYNESFNIKTNQLYGTYNNHNIIIGTKKYIENLEEYDPSTIYIIDDRDAENSDMSIYNSKEIFRPKTMKDIINLLLEYERKYPSRWSRTQKSMYREWWLHTACYYSKYEQERTSQVDFDNSDELVYADFMAIIDEIFNNQLDELLSDEIDNVKERILSK